MRAGATIVDSSSPTYVVCCSAYATVFFFVASDSWGPPERRVKMTIPLQSAPPSRTHFDLNDSAATRHLCAGAYLDDVFRDDTLRHVYYQPRRIVAPSYGFQLVPVLWHCLRARRADIIRDIAIVALFLVALTVSKSAVVVVVSLLLVQHFGVAVWRLGRDTIRAIRAGDDLGIRRFLARGMQLLFGMAIASVAFFFMLSILAGIAVNSLESSPFEDPLADPSAVVAQALLLFVAGLMLALVAIALPAIVGLWRQRQIERLVPGTRQQFPPRTQRFVEIQSQQGGNTVVYAGYRPFVGAGEPIDTSGFAQRLVRAPANGLAVFGLANEGDREFAEIPFTTEDLVNHLRGHLGALTREQGAGWLLPGLVVEDRVFLSGTEVSHLSPYTDPATVAEIIRNPTGPARHYLAGQVISWRGELVTTVHVHASVQGRSLYLEITTTALPPCDETYRIVDQVNGTGPIAYLRALVRGIADTPRTVAAAPFRLVRALIDQIATSATVVAGTALPPGFDYGARVSVRELGAATFTRNHTQTEDILKQKRIIERRVFAAVLDFLDAHGVDTTEYRQRAANILNAGAVNVGSGTMFVDSAVGQQNQGPGPVPAPAGRH